MLEDGSSKATDSTRGSIGNIGNIGSSSNMGSSISSSKNSKSGNSKEASKAKTRTKARMKSKKNKRKRSDTALQFAALAMGTAIVIFAYSASRSMDHVVNQTSIQMVTFEAFVGGDSPTNAALTAAKMDATGNLRSSAVQSAAVHSISNAHSDAVVQVRAISNGNANGHANVKVDTRPTIGVPPNPDSTKYDSIIIPGAKSPYAYVFLVGGINEKDPRYRGFLLNVVVATEALRLENSKADIVLFCQFVAESDLEVLPEEDMRTLEQLDVHIHYLPKIPPGETTSFYDVIFEKFQILLLVQYRRVLFLDSDVIPLENLDYIFELSDQGPNSTLKDTLIVATRGEPANAGFMLMRPGYGEYEECQDIRERQIESVRDFKHPKFDWINGWGHNFREAGDKWEAIQQNGTQWRYWSSHADQGLLYYWAKYAKREASLVIGQRIQNWSTNSDGIKYMQTQMHKALNSLPPPYNEPKWRRHTISDNRPYVSYSHFTGKTKPWLGPMPPGDCLSPRYAKHSPKNYWFHTLCKANEKFKMGMDMDNWTAEKDKIGHPPLGGVPQWGDMSSRMSKLHDKGA